VTFIYALRSLLFYVGYALSLMLYSISANIGALFLSHHLVFRLCVYWCHFSLWWLRITCGIRHEVSGAENIPHGACVVLSKHQSAWETQFMQIQFYPASPVVKRELMWIPFFGWGMRFFDPIPINRSDRNSALKSILRQGDEKLKRGQRIIIYPEGTRTLPGASHTDYSVGGAMLACRSKAIVVPVAHNSGDCWPRGTLIKYPGVIKVIIGKPIDASLYSAKTLNTDVRDWIEQQMPSISSAYK
jgi:1-acyl-sn-glycerol-3-phosphate acyltransferase